VSTGHRELRDLLGSHPFFAGMPTDIVDRIEGLTVTAEFPAGSWIARTGGVADTLHAVIDGRAAIELAAAGRAPLVVATAHAGDVIGWSWFVEPHRWRFDVLALDHVRTLAIDASELRAACEADHELGYRVAHRLARVVAARLEATRHQLVDIYGHAG
jgi:CRP/FNR family transcriptional regulator, cyclic AMP receptor protein